MYIHVYRSTIHVVILSVRMFVGSASNAHSVLVNIFSARVGGKQPATALQQDMALITSRPRQAPAAIIRLLLVVVVHVLLATLCNAEPTKDACIHDVDVDSGLARISYYEISALPPRELQATLLFPGAALPQNGLLTVLRVHVNSSSGELQRCFRVSADYGCSLNVPVVNDLDAADEFNWTSPTADVCSLLHRQR